MAKSFRSRISPFLGCFACLLWMTLVAVGVVSLRREESTPGPIGRSLAECPPEILGTSGLGRPHIFMAVHPRCPCTVASLEALTEIVAQSPREAVVRLYVFRPERSATDWARPLRQIPGSVEVIDDPGGVLSLRMGLITSGTVSAYDQEARLRFFGGITRGRSQKSSCEGSEAVRAVANRMPPGCSTAPVYGCEIIVNADGGLEEGAGT